MGSNTTTQDTQSTQVNQIPQWVQNAGQQNYAFAQNVAAQPLTQYQGQMVADVAPQTQQAWNLAANNTNAGTDQYNAATAGYLNSLGQTPANVRAGQLSNTNLSPYMNPYTQSVINTTLPIMQQNLALQQNQQQNAANSANAFGGSRQAIQQGVTQAQGAQGMAQMAAGLNQANFGQAQSAAQQDIANRLTAATANQQAQQAKTNSDILASQGLTNTGDSIARQNAANFTMLSQAGAAQSQQAQDQINAQMAKFNQAYTYPQQQLGILESSLGMTPYNTATQGQSSTQTTTPTNWGALALGGLDALSGFFKPGASDKTMKTDIQSMGKDPATGIKMAAFRYKGDPKSYPKVVGPMAQDVAKKLPGAVGKVGSKLAVAGPVLGALSPTAGGTPPSSPGVARGLSTFMPNKAAKSKATTAPRAGAKAFMGALSNTKLRVPKGALA